MLRNIYVYRWRAYNKFWRERERLSDSFGVVEGTRNFRIYIKKKVWKRWRPLHKNYNSIKLQFWPTQKERRKKKQKQKTIAIAIAIASANREYLFRRTIWRKELTFAHAHTYLSVLDMAFLRKSRSLIPPSVWLSKAQSSPINLFRSSFSSFGGGNGVVTATLFPGDGIGPEIAASVQKVRFFFLSFSHFCMFILYIRK